MSERTFVGPDETKIAVDAAPASEAAEPATGKRPRGFAAMDRAAVRAIARIGGRADHARGTAHEFTTEEARTAGRKGGQAPHRVRGRKVATAATSQVEVVETNEPAASVVQ